MSEAIAVIQAIKRFTRHRIARNMFWVAGGTVAGNLFALFGNMYLARVLQPAGFGKIALAQTWAQYLLIIIDFGFTTYTIREIAKNRGRKMEFVNTALPFQLGAAFVFTAFFCLGTLMFVSSSEMRWLMFGSVFVVYGTALNLEWAFQGEERMSLVAVSRVLSNVLPFILYVLFVRTAGDILGVPVYRGVGAIAAAVFLLALLNGKVSFRRFSWKAAAGLLRRTQFFWYIQIFVQVYFGTDILLLGYFRPAEEVGYYAAAFRLFGLLNLILSLVNSAIFPVLSDFGENDQPKFFKLIRRYLAFNIVLGSLLMIVFSLFGRPIIQLLYGPAFASSAAPFKILILGIVILMCNGPFAQPLLAKGHERRVLVTVIVCAIFNFAGNLLFIPRYGAMASAVVFVLSLLLGTAWAIILFNRKIGNLVGHERV